MPPPANITLTLAKNTRCRKCAEILYTYCLRGSDDIFVCLECGWKKEEEIIMDEAEADEEAE